MNLIRTRYKYLESTSYIIILIIHGLINIHLIK